MKKHILWGVVAIAISLIAVSASAVAASKTAKMSMPARVAKLERQVKQLRKSSTLQRKLLFAVADATVCLLGPIQPAGRYGDVNSANTDGYLYRDQTGDEFYTDALAPAMPGETPQLYLASIDAKCMKSNGASSRANGSFQSVQDQLRTAFPMHHATTNNLQKLAHR